MFSLHTNIFLKGLKIDVDFLLSIVANSFSK